MFVAILCEGDIPVFHFFMAEEINGITLKK